MTVNNIVLKIIRSEPFVALIIISVFFLFLSSYYNNATASLNDGNGNEISPPPSGLEECRVQTGGSPTSVAIETDKTTYVTGSQIIISPYVLNERGCPIVKNVTMQITHIDSDLNEYVQNFHTDRDPFGIDELSFADESSIILDHSGKFNITLTTLINGSNQTSWKLIEVKDFSQIRSAIMLYIGVASFAGLITVIILGVLGIIKSYAIGEILRFVFISGIMLSIVISFTFVEQEFGSFAPVGLVTWPIDSEDPAGRTEWVINIGGTREFTPSNTFGGIQIPINILLFGIAGGYLRYLYKTSRTRPRQKILQSTYLFKWDNIPGIEENKLKDFLKEHFSVFWIENEQFQKADKTISISDGKNTISIVIDDRYERAKLKINGSNVYQFIVREENGTSIYQDMSWREWIFHQSLEDIAILFLSPLLAIAVWFLLTQAGLRDENAVYTLAVVSFTVGLITEEVVQALIHFVQSILGTTDREGSQVRKREDKATMTDKSTQL